MATQVLFIITPILGEDSTFDYYIFQLGWELQPPTRLLTIYSVVYLATSIFAQREEIQLELDPIFDITFVKLQAQLVNVTIDSYQSLEEAAKGFGKTRILTFSQRLKALDKNSAWYFECSGHFRAYLLDFIYSISHLVVEDSIEMERFLSLQIADHPGQFGSLSQELQKQQLSQRALEDVRSACTPWNGYEFINTFCFFTPEIWGRFGKLLWYVQMPLLKIEPMNMIPLIWNLLWPTNSRRIYIYIYICMKVLVLFMKRSRSNLKCRLLVGWGQDEMLWDVPLPSNSGKWRFIGFPY